MKIAELADELSTADCGDKRLNKRAAKMVEALAHYPNLSIPSVFKSKAEIEASYRFFDNERVTPEKILGPHIEATFQRIAAVDLALLVQDTTEIDLTRPEQQVEGAGPMDGPSRRGGFFHPMIAFDGDGVPLGLIGQTMWTRNEIDTSSTKAQKAAKRKKTPIEDKESNRWLRGFSWAEQAAAACPETLCVCISDSESDIYQLFATAVSTQHTNLQLLVRAGQNRNTDENQDWVEQVRQTPLIGEQLVTLRERKAKLKIAKSARERSRPARSAQLEIRKAKFTLLRPQAADHKLPASLSINVVLCEEVNPRPGEDPIRWVLVTTLPIESEEDVRKIIAFYCRRWRSRSTSERSNRDAGSSGDGLKRSIAYSTAWRSTQ